MQPEPGNQSLCFYLNDSFQFQIFKGIFIQLGEIKKSEVDPEGHVMNADHHHE